MTELPRTKYPFQTLEIGGYFPVDDDLRQSLSSLCTKYGRRLGKVFVTRSIPLASGVMERRVYRKT